MTSTWESPSLPLLFVAMSLSLAGPMKNMYYNLVVIYCSVYFSDYSWARKLEGFGRHLRLWFICGCMWSIWHPFYLLWIILLSPSLQPLLCCIFSVHCMACRNFFLSWRFLIAFTICIAKSGYKVYIYLNWDFAPTFFSLLLWPYVMCGWCIFSSITSTNWKHILAMVLYLTLLDLYHMFLEGVSIFYVL